MERVCENCYHCVEKPRHEFIGDHPDGVNVDENWVELITLRCHRYPPDPHDEDGNEFVLVSPKDHCGEWRAKEICGAPPLWDKDTNQGGADERD